MADTDYSHISAIMDAAMPYIDTRSRISADLISKLLGLFGCFQNLKKKNMAACGFDNQKIDLEKLLTAVRPICYDKERSIVDQILSMFQAKRMFDLYKTYMDAMKMMQGSEASASPFGDFASAFSSDNNTGNSSGFDISNFLNGFSKSSFTDSNKVSNEYADSVPENNFNYDHDETLKNDFNTQEATDHNLHENSGSNSNNSMIDMLKAMIPPEQQSTFENLSMLFNTMSYDNNSKSGENKENNNG